MADRGFDTHIQETVAIRGVLVISLVCSINRCLPMMLKRLERIAEFRMHIEYVIGRGRHFEIHDLVSDINSVCMFLANFDVSLVAYCIFICTVN